jgi:hypothetical protein
LSGERTRRLPDDPAVSAVQPDDPAVSGSAG